MLPSIASPIAPPSSELVSAVAAAAPARPFGAAPMAMSVTSVTTAASPSALIVDPAISGARSSFVVATTT